MCRAVSDDDTASSFKSAFRTRLFVAFNLSCSSVFEVLVTVTKGTSCGGGGMTKQVSKIWMHGNTKTRTEHWPDEINE